MFIDLLVPLGAWHWLVLGLLLFIAEAFGAAGLLLGPAVAAFLLAGVLAFVEVSWPGQVGLFAVLAAVCSAVYWKKFRAYDRRQPEHPLLNDPAARLVGQRYTLQTPLANGSGTLRVGDTRWQIKGREEIAAGETVEVVAHEGMILVVRRAPDADAAPADR